jgi:hypothetical protein
VLIKGLFTNFNAGVSMTFSHIKLILILILTVASVSACGGGADEVSPDMNVPAETISNNIAPTVDAGADQSVKGQTLVTLSGTTSDRDGEIASVQWTQISGEAVVLTNSLTIAANQRKFGGKVVVQAYDTLGNSVFSTPITVEIL